MVEHDSGVGEGAGEVGELADLRMEQPGVEAEAERRQAGEPRKVESSRMPFGRLAYIWATLGSSSQAEEWRMPRNRPLPADISASSTALAWSPSRRLTWLTMPAQIAALP
ncbi:hypothetical protein ACVMB0_001058 [Bradyrhizobium sp. USDA 4451]